MVRREEGVVKVRAPHLPQRLSFIGGSGVLYVLAPFEEAEVTVYKPQLSRPRFIAWSSSKSAWGCR